MLKYVEINVSKDLKIGDKDEQKINHLIINYFEQKKIYYRNLGDGVFVVKLKDYRCQLRLKLNNFIQEN